MQCSVTRRRRKPEGLFVCSHFLILLLSGFSFNWHFILSILQINVIIDMINIYGTSQGRQELIPESELRVVL